MMTVREIASFLDGDVVGNASLEIAGIAKIEDAKAGELTFLSNPKYEKFLESTNASTVIVSRSLDISKHRKLPPSIIRVEDAYASFVIAIQKFSPSPVACFRREFIRQQLLILRPKLERTAPSARMLLSEGGARSEMEQRFFRAPFSATGCM